MGDSCRWPLVTSMWTRMARSMLRSLITCARRLQPCPADSATLHLGRQSTVVPSRSALLPARPCLTQLTASRVPHAAGLVPPSSPTGPPPTLQARLLRSTPAPRSTSTTSPTTPRQISSRPSRLLTAFVETDATCRGEITYSEFNKLIERAAAVPRTFGLAPPD